MKRTLIAIVVALVLAFPWQGGAAAGDIAITDAWSPPTLKGASTGAVYLTIVNRGAKPDRLTGIETPAAARAELHEELMTGGVMSMKPVADFTIAPGATVMLAPGHYHIMLTGLKTPLAAGDNLPLTLRFEQAGAIELSVPVKPAQMPMKMH